MAKKKTDDKTNLPTNIANLSQNKDKLHNIPVGAKNGAGQGAGQGPK